MDRDSNNIKETNAQQSHPLENSHSKPIAKNPNPRANENIPVSEVSDKQNTKNANGVGSEITDGEDA